MIESVREGYLLHYGEPRVIVGADADLRLLAGDYLYAIGLEQLAGLGNLPAVRELSDLISIGAQLHADDGPNAPRAGGRGALARVDARDRDGRAGRSRGGEVRAESGQSGRRGGRAGRGDLDGVGGGPGGCACATLRKQ